MGDTARTAAVVVLAGGSGTRLGADRNKVYLPLGDVPLLAWSLRTLDAVPGTVAMVLVIRPGDETDAEAAIAAAAPATPVTVVAGGPTRAASERAGLVPLRPGIADGSIEVVLVHDGARPLVSAALAGAVDRAARRHGGAIPGLPIAGEILVDAGDRLVPADIEHLRGVQTPQGFRARALVAAHDAAAADGFEALDTAAMVARYAGIAAAVVPGDPRNLKVTTAEDLEHARRLAGSGGRAQDP